MEVAGSFKQLSDAQASQLKRRHGISADRRSARRSHQRRVAGAGQLRVRAGDVTLGVPTAQTDLPATLKLKCLLATNA